MKDEFWQWMVERKKNNILTKSKYIAGIECPKYLWILFNHPELIKQASIADEFKFKQGEEVGNLAKTLFPKGIDLPTDYKLNIEKTKEALKENKPLFEAGFQANNLFSRADILVPVKDEYDIIEVKSGTEVKDINIHDVSFQKYVYELSGIKIRKCFLMHLNKEYIRSGSLKVKELLKKEDITKEVNNINNIKENIEDFFRIISSKEPPKPIVLKEKLIKDGHHDCFNDNCLSLPSNHVFCLYRGNKLACELYEEGIELIKDIPNNTKLTDRQQIQREAEINNKVHIHKESIKHFLKTLKYPLNCLDFETFSTAIPKFNCLKPYSQVPFQFSLHVQDKSKLNHYSYLYKGNSDPRLEFITELRKVLKDKGSIVVYNQSFEIGRLKELALSFPEHKNWIENNVLPRIVDLIVPFRNFSYYNPKQEGSASIKDVLPAITNKSYKGMEIADGSTASVMFYKMAYGNLEKGEKERIYNNLLKYCGLDTLAEVMVVDKLRELVK